VPQNEKTLPLDSFWYYRVPVDADDPQLDEVSAMTKIAEKVVAVTGAGSGIGRALAVELVASGAHVALSDVNEAALEETVALVRGETRVTSHVVDVRDRSAVARYAAEALAEHGGADVIINNAGLAVRATIEDMTYEDFALVIDVNLWGVVHGTKEFLPLLRKRGGGHIVNISSINAMVPFAKNGPYNAAKYAVLGFSETLMQELAGGPIRVTCVHPGGIKTNIARNGRGVSAAEAAFFERVAMTSPRTAAKTILRGVARDQPRVYIGADAMLMAAAKRIAPDLAVKVSGKVSSNPA
jgi:NAD(P)-dependent dehydrogenase (short-subunit alcohol dehydrogenase family)